MLKLWGVGSSRTCPKKRGRSKGKGDGHRGKGKGWIWGKGIWQVDGEDNQGDYERNQPEQKQGSSGSVTKEKAKIIDEVGYELIKRPRRLGQYTPEIFAVGAGKMGDSGKELSKKRFCGDERSRETCNRWS